MKTTPTNTSGKWLDYFLFVFLLIALSPYVYLSFFTHPIADDYCCSITEREFGFWQAFTNQYFSWSGRYSTNFLILLNPMIINSLAIYKLVPIFLMILSLLGLYSFFFSISRHTFSRICVLNAALLFLMLYLMIMPSLAQGIYWYTSAIAYQSGIIFSLFYFSLLYNYCNERYIFSKQLHFTITIFTLVICIGFNEGTTLLLIGINACIAWILLRTKKKLTVPFILLMCLGIIAAGIMLFAPGNMAREQNFHDHRNLFHSLLFTFLQTARFGFKWIVNLPFLLFSLLWTVILFQKKEQFAFLLFPSFIKPWMIACVLAYLFFIFIFPPYWSTNILGQHRTVNVACFFFLCCWFLSLNLIVNSRYIEKYRILPIMGKKHIFASLFVITILLFCNGNGYTAISEIMNGKVQKFDERMTERIHLLSCIQNKNATVYIEPIRERPLSLFVLDLSEDSAYWINYCQAKYFDVKGIICK